MVIYERGALHSTIQAHYMGAEIGGSSRGFRLEYEVFRFTVHLFFKMLSKLEPKIV